MVGVWEHVHRTNGSDDIVLAEDLKADVLVGHAMKLVRENAKIGKAKKAAAKKTTKTAKAEKEEKKILKNLQNKSKHKNNKCFS